MKKIMALMMVLILSISLTACGGKDDPAPAQSSTDGTEANASDDDSKTAEAEYVSMTFGDILMSVPSVFGAVEEKEGMYVSAGPNASITVTPAMEIDLQPSEWDESLAKDMLDPLFGSVYTDMELSAFEGDVNMNGNTAVYVGFYGKNAEGTDRLVQVVRLFNTDLTSQYIITYVQKAEDEFLTAEVGGKIVNSIALAK